MRRVRSLHGLARSLVLCIVGISTAAYATDQGYRLTGLKPALKVLPVAESVVTETGAASASPALPRIEFLDPSNPGLRLLQRYGDAMRDLPMDANGFPDWMKSLNEGKIQPRPGLKPGDSMEVLDLDVLMKNTKEMPNVRFPHRSHTLWLACSNCHPHPFQAKAGSSTIVMADIFRGQFCGMCHDRVAFVTFFSCQRCHNAPRQDAR